MRATAHPFRFDQDAHEYISLETGDVLPHITGMLTAAGYVDDTWLTQEGRDRGHAVHEMTAAYDLGGLSLDRCVSQYRGYLLAHVAAMAALGMPAWRHIEEPFVHPVHLYGGRPDRVGKVRRIEAILDEKTGGPLPAKVRGGPTPYGIQTALQAILVSAHSGLPATAYDRLGVYLKRTGRFSVERHRDPQDFREASRIIRETCHGNGQSMEGR